MLTFGFLQPPNDKTKVNLALINTFPEIGWVDPFPIEVKTVKGK